MADSTNTPVSADTIRVGTNDGLVAALAALGPREEWDGPVGRAVLYHLRIRARWIARLGQIRSDVAAADLVDDLVAAGWELLVTQRCYVMNATQPWGLLMQALTVEAVRDVRSAELVAGTDALRWSIHGGWHTAQRLGFGAAPFVDRMVLVDRDPTATAALAAGKVDTSGWDPGLRALCDEMVGAGASYALAAELLATGLDVLNLTTRRSHIHYTAYRDPRLAGLLQVPQIRALMNLLIGSRRDGPDGSAWLALREAARDGGSVSLADAHPKSLPRLRVLAQAWLPPAPHGHRQRHAAHRHGPAATSATPPRLRSASAAQPAPRRSCARREPPQRMHTTGCATRRVPTRRQR